MLTISATTNLTSIPLEYIELIINSDSPLKIYIQQNLKLTPIIIIRIQLARYYKIVIRGRE